MLELIACELHMNLFPQYFPCLQEAFSFSGRDNACSLYRTSVRWKGMWLQYLQFITMWRRHIMEQKNLNERFLRYSSHLYQFLFWLKHVIENISDFLPLCFISLKPIWTHYTSDSELIAVHLIWINKDILIIFPVFTINKEMFQIVKCLCV